MKTLAIDLETRSSVDINKAGAYKYAESADFDILLFACSIDDGPVQVYDLACREDLPPEIINAIMDPAVEKDAYNCSFERICLSHWLRNRGLFTGQFLDPSSWRCSMVWAAYNGLPLGLAKCGAALGLDKQKLEEGKDLIRYFCTPSRTTGRSWNEPEHAPDKWALFKEYNKRDVEVELQIRHRLRHFPVPDFVWEEYILDQRINDRGIRIDRPLVENALSMDAASRDEIMIQMQKLTGLENPNSVAQLKEYLQRNGIVTDSLGKKDVQKLLETAPEKIAPVLSLRLQSAKSSVRKYQAMKLAACQDDRLRGMTQFYGASRTGRFSGRIVQLQNLPRNAMPDLADARALVRRGDYESMEMLYPSIPGVLSELIRTAFIPRRGTCFIVADFSAIEARVLSYLAGETWRIQAFHDGKDIYSEAASRMFGVPVEKHGQNAELRQRGKQAELACGYNGSVGALKAMGALDLGMEEDELQPLVDAWRDANPKIVQYWYDIEAAAMHAVKQHGTASVGLITFFWEANMLFLRLPSGRTLAYAKPKMGMNRFGRESITYMGNDAAKKWNRIETYGGRLVENLTQAISRDILVNSMMALSDYDIVAHVHDEVIIEAPPELTVEKVCEIMSQPPAWLPDIELRADGYECNFYMKD